MNPALDLIALTAGAAPLAASRGPLPRRALPDVAKGSSGHGLRHPLDRAGMAGIELPVLLPGPGGALQLTPARASAFVNLVDPAARGIHMSRLFLRVQEGLESGPLDAGLLLRILEQMLTSHADLATEAHLALSFEWMTKRPALVSGHAGWRSYPVTLEGSLTPRGAVMRVGATVTYSSTCPCSAALARQLIQEAFLARFGRQESIPREDLHTWLGSADAICATPHSQRSLARAVIELDRPEAGPGFAALVDLLEAALGTPVQAAVKREDEQAFASLNGENPMFCEDAARRIKRALEGDPRIRDYHVRCEHQESLHPHDAVSVVTKGLPGGLQA